MYRNLYHVDYDVWAGYECKNCHDTLYAYCNSTGDKLFCCKCNKEYGFDDENIQSNGKFYEMRLAEITPDSPRYKNLPYNNKEE